MLDVTQSKMRDKALVVYGAMVKDAKGDIWEGNLTELVTSLGLMANYSRIVKVLKASDAVEQLRKGAMGYPSQWRIKRTDSDLADVEIGPGQNKVKGTTGIQRELDDLSKLVGNVNVPLAMADVARRLDLLEGMLTRLLNDGSVSAGGDDNGTA